MSILYSVIARAVPLPALAPLHGDRAQLAAMPFWKGKRVAAKVMNRVFSTCAPAPPAPATPRLWSWGWRREWLQGLLCAPRRLWS